MYSGIFAAAATTDAGFKQKRSDQWDRAIADIKHDLDQPAVKEDMEIEDSEETHESIKPEQETEGISVRFKPLFDDPQEVLPEGAPLDNGPLWPTNTGPDLYRNFVAPNSIYAGYRARTKALASRWTTKKMRTVELSVDKLILRMLIHLDDCGLRDNIKDAVPDSCLDLFAAPVTKLKALLLFTNDQHMEATLYPDPNADIDHLPSSHKHGVTFVQDNYGDFHHTASDLTMSLADLFEKNRIKQLSYRDLIANIAHKLHTCTAPPNLECWNVLLRGFMHDSLDNADLVEPTLLAIRNANVRMNETTLKATLRYFIMIDSRTRFAHFVDKMRGLRGGLGLTVPDIKINDSGRARLVRDETTGKVIQNPYATPGVFEVLIQGVLHFVGFDAALRVCNDMGQKGWGLSIRGLTPLLDDRAQHADYESGCQVWNLIKALQEKSRMNSTPEKLFAQTYSAMLRLCSACNEMTRFDEILREARAAKYSHRELLALFKQEIYTPPRVRKITPSKVDIRELVTHVTFKDLQDIEKKTSPDLSGTITARGNSVGDESWPGTMPDTGLKTPGVEVVEVHEDEV
jgi:hypothetical protein